MGAGTRRRNRPESGAAGHRRVDLGMVGFGERKTEELQIIFEMLADAEARPDDDAAHGRLIEDGAAGDVGHRHVVPLCHPLHDHQQVLQRFPTARLPDKAAVLHLGPGFERVPVGSG